MERLVVLGAGESGVGAAILGKKLGMDVFVSDFGTISESHKNELTAIDVPFEEGRHSEELILVSSATIIKSPGIPDTASIVVKARELKIPVVSEIEFAAKHTDAKFIAITGSNGKTTTTLLTHYILQKAGMNVGMAGNIGQSLARQVATKEYDLYVLELSSFQLDGMYEFRADVAVLLNITPDHLDRYDYKFENYVDSKFRIAQNQTSDQYFISYVDDPVVKAELQKRDIGGFKLGVSLGDVMLNGAYVGKNNVLQFNVNNHITKVFNIKEKYLPLRGKHNMVNTMMAVMACLTVGLNEKTIVKSLDGFNNASHRLELVTEVNGVKYINDSKATNVDSVKYALDSFDKPIIWIAGGVDKGNDYSQLDELVFEKVKALVCVGKDNSKLKEYFGDKLPMIIETQDMEDAVSWCNEVSESGDHVLLSPACASFDLFKNYEDRGDIFKNAVKRFEELQKAI